VEPGKFYAQQSIPSDKKAFACLDDPCEHQTRCDLKVIAMSSPHGILLVGKEWSDVDETPSFGFNTCAPLFRRHLFHWHVVHPSVERSGDMCKHTDTNPPHRFAHVRCHSYFPRTSSTATRCRFLASLATPRRLSYCRPTSSCVRNAILTHRLRLQHPSAWPGFDVLCAQAIHASHHAGTPVLPFASSQQECPQDPCQKRPLRTGDRIYSTLSAICWLTRVRTA